MKFLHHSVKPQTGLTAEESPSQTSLGVSLGLQSVKRVMGPPVALRLAGPSSIGRAGGLPSVRDHGGRATAHAIPVRTAVMMKGRIVLIDCVDMIGMTGALDKYGFSSYFFREGALVRISPLKTFFD